MSNAKYTPGPWEVLRSRATGAATVIGTRHPDYLDSDGDGADLAYTCENGGNIPIDRWQAEANARLIAAAPELLEVLTDLMNMRGKCFIPNNGDWWDRKARAALAKAQP